MKTNKTAQDPVEQVATLLSQLSQGPVALSDQELSQAELLGLGLRVDGAQVALPQGIELLEAAAIQAALSAPAEAWLQDLRLFPAIGSTNSWMMEGLAQQSLVQPGLAGLVALAECQLAGRGRRGRVWRSPLGSNLALSLGFSLPLPVAQLGGLSLVVGMAAVDALDPDGQLGLRLKWPNDLLLEGRKLAGILVEVAQRDGLCEVCVGIGVNWRIPTEVRALIDQPVAEVAEFAPQLGRNAGAGLLISRIVEFVQAFAEGGFEPMRPHYDNIHAYQGQACRLIGPQDTIEGWVLGVSETGELRLQTSNGVQTFSSGEVSLRK
jgi:BirA family biotin operon repressor/biotin-[acetyl-CoA-carboxylase] ligase